MGFHTPPGGPPTHSLSPVIPNNVRPVRITAAAGTYLARTSSAVRSTAGDDPPQISSPLTAVYNPKAFIPRAASLRQAFAHCGRFSTAATRRCLGSVSVPVRRVTLSRPLPIIALVGHYPTNKLIGRRTIPGRNHTFGPGTLCGITGSFPPLSRTQG